MAATTGQKSLAAGPTFVVAESVLAMAHTGFIGAVVGLGIAAATYVAVEESMAGRDENSFPDDSQREGASAHHQQHKGNALTEKHRSLAYRLFNGKSTREALATNEGSENDDGDTEPRDDQKQGVFPQFPHNEMLRLGSLANVGKLARFDPHMDMLLGKGLIVAGVQGMGKSNIAALVQESAARCDMPVVMFDLKREFLR